MGADTSFSRGGGASISSRKRKHTEYAVSHTNTGVVIASEYSAHMCETYDDPKPVKKARKRAAGDAPTENRLRRYAFEMAITLTAMPY
jgi:hypothetical protein